MEKDSTFLLPLLTPEEAPAFTTINPACANKLVLVCDHASNRVPQRLNQMGLNDAELASHIAWDPGAALVATGLSARLDAMLILSGYSRLVIDCNRPLESPELIPVQSGGITVPGNQALSNAQREQRIQSLFAPYHRGVASALDLRDPLKTHLLSIHSFTPHLQGQSRPWHIGVAAYQNHEFARKLYVALQQFDDCVVGFNQPYAIEAEFDYTIPRQGEARGIASAMVEIRQDTLQSEAGVAFWVNRLAHAVHHCMG